MDMDIHKVNQIIGNNHRFISPFCEPCGYYIVETADGGCIDEKAITLYWEKLKYAEKNVDLLIQEGFKSSFYDFYGVNQGIVKTPSDMCRQLVVESFVLILGENNITIGSCVSNSAFLFGHFIEYEWDCDWNLRKVHIC